MAKTNTPFLSLGAQGSVGKAITAQRRGSATMVRQKPLPADPYSLPQAYQRWNYQVYAYLWTQQSAATQAEYRSAGVRFHLTGFQYWMKYQLTNLSDFLGYWRLDNAISGKYLDFSKYGNHATIFGPSPATGVIDRCSYFDGINDRLSIPDSPLWVFGTDDFSISFFINPVATSRCIFSHGNNNDTSYMVFDNRLWGAARPGLAIRDAGVWTLRFRLDNDWTHETWLHVALIREGTLAADWHVYVDAVDQAKTLEGGSYAASIPDYTFPFLFGSRLSGGAYWEFLKGYVDQIQFRNRALSQAEVATLSARKYP